MARKVTAAIVGSGPNGLAAAVKLAQEGVKVTVFELASTVGGGVRSTSIDGLIHDECATVHSLALGSRFWRELDGNLSSTGGLSGNGLRFVSGEVDCAHPLDDGGAGILLRGVADTAAKNESKRWGKIFAPMVEEYEALSDAMLEPFVPKPKNIKPLTRFGIQALLPATVNGSRFETDNASALWQGIAAHATSRPDLPLSSAIGCALIAAGHRNGWVVAEGGSQKIADLLLRVLERLGGHVETDAQISNPEQLRGFDIRLLDISPKAVLQIFGGSLPSRIERGLARFRHGPGAFKLDLVVRGGIPWANVDCRRATIVHVGGSASEVIRSEKEVVSGRMPRQPFVLVGQQYLVDESRYDPSTEPDVPIWTYAHVPNNFGGDATPEIIKQLERFAPGVSERIVAKRTRGARDFEAYNPNYVGGDIIGGATDFSQLLLRPRLTPNPYDLGQRGLYLCSASTPPGAGAHGMCGLAAAERALNQCL